MNDYLRLTLAAAVVIASSAAPLTVSAQAYPSKPIRVIIAFTAGGATDPVVQLVGARLTEAWGQQLIMDHRPGAAGMIGAQLAAKAAPDGYTLFMCNSGSFSGSVALQPKLTYDPVKDFTAITPAIVYPALLVVHPSLPVRNVQELVALARSRPGGLNFGSAGTATSSHLSGELFNTMAGVKMIHVPYKGNSAALTDLVSGQVQLIFSNIPPTLPFVRSGQLRALGVSSAQRFAGLPDVPTIAESGLPGFEITPWIGFCGPAGMPRDIVTRLNTEIVKALNTPSVKDAFLKSGSEVAPMTPEQTEEFIKKDIAKWIQIVKAANVKLE